MHGTLFQMKCRDFCHLTTDHSYSILSCMAFKKVQRKNDLPERGKNQCEKEGSFNVRPQIIKYVFYIDKREQTDIAVLNKYVKSVIDKRLYCVLFTKKSRFVLQTTEKKNLFIMAHFCQQIFSTNKLLSKLMSLEIGVTFREKGL